MVGWTVHKYFNHGGRKADYLFGDNFDTILSLLDEDLTVDTELAIEFEEAATEIINVDPEKVNC